MLILKLLFLWILISVQTHMGIKTKKPVVLDMINLDT